MSATMARQAGRAQLEQSKIRLALNMAKIANGGFSLAAIEEIQYLIKRPCTAVREEKKQEVQSPEQKMINAAIQRHPALLRQKQTNRWLPCQTGTAKNPQSCWRWKQTGAPLSGRHRQPTPEPTLSLGRMPPVPPCDNELSQRSQITDLPPRYVYSHTPLPSVQFFTFDAYAQNSQYDTDYNPEMLTYKGTSTG